MVAAIDCVYSAGFQCEYGPGVVSAVPLGGGLPTVPASPDVRVSSQL